MDPNNTTNQPTQPVQAPQPQVPQPQPPVQPVTPPPVVPPPQPMDTASAGVVETKSNALIYVVIGLLIVVLLALAGLFFYRQFAAATTSTVEKKQVSVPTQAPITPTIVVPTYSSPEEKDAMGVDVGNVDSQLKIIQDDVNSL